MLAGEYGPVGLRVGARGPGGSWCVVAGRIEGLSELARDLGLPTDSDAEAILAAGFVDRRERVLDALEGSFALAAWDDAGKRGLLAADRLGTRPLFLRGEAPRLRFATELHGLLKVTSATPRPADAAVSRWLMYGALETDETLYEGIRRLGGGRILRLGGGRWEEVRYWRPRYREPLQADRAQAAVEVRAAVERAVSARCTSDLMGVMLSGGLDSTSVAAAAAQPGAARGRVVAYSAVFPDHPATDESELIRRTAADLGLRARSLEVRASGALHASAEHAERWALPAASPNLFFLLPLLELARRDGVGVMLDGEGGDELFGAVPGLVPAKRRSALARARGALRGGLRRARRTGRPANRIPLNSPTPGLVRCEVERPQPLASDGPPWWSSLADRLTAARERAGVFDHFRRQLATAGLGGAGHPFLDDLPLIELVLGLPPQLAIDPVLDRPVLRDAMRGLIPDEIRLRTTKSTFDRVLVDCMVGPDRELLRELLTSPSAEILSYVRPEPLRRIAEIPARPGILWAWTAWRLASTELWLRRLAGLGSII